MSAALLQDANKQHTIADDLESALHVLTWTTLRYVPHKMPPLLLTMHLRKVYDEFDTLTGTGGGTKGDKLAGRKYVPRALELKKPSPLVDLLKTMSDPFVAVYGDEPDEVMEREPQYTPMQDQKTFVENLHLRHDDRLTCSKSPEWFQKTIETALNKPLWPLDDGSSALPGQVLGKRPRSPSVAASNEVKFANHHS